MTKRGRSIRFARGAALAAFALLTACSGTGLSPTGASPTETTSAPKTVTNTSTAAYPATAATRDEAPNPFGDRSGPPPGGREVIENPSVAEIMLPGSLPEMSWGRDDAPVTIIKYASLTCPYCRQFHLEVFPTLKREYIDTGKVRFIIREFPIGQSSGNATIALRCAPPAKYLDLYGKFLSQQATWVSQEVRLDPIFAVASQVGMKRPEFDACLQNQGMIDGLKWVKERGRKLGIIGTPNFFIGGKLVKKALGVADVRALIDPLLTAPATAAASVPKG